MRIEPSAISVITVGSARALGEGHGNLGRVRVHDTAAEIEDRSLGCVDELGRARERGLVGSRKRNGAARLGPRVDVDALGLHVFGNVDRDGAGPARGCNLECTGYDRQELSG